MFAQATDDGTGTLEGDGDTTPSAPVDNWIIPLMLLGCVLGYYIIRKRKKMTTI